MKDLKSLAAAIGCTANPGDEKRIATDIIYDSRKLVEGCVFVALRGMNFDGHDFLQEAVKKAAAVVCEDASSINIPGDCRVFLAENSRKALALLSEEFFDHPDKEVGVIGITGTKGKTTTTYLIRNILEGVGFSCGLMGTIETIIGSTHVEAKNTTPESYIVQKNLRAMADAGMKYCVMEVSSQGLMMDRVTGVDFQIGVYTNLSPDHIGPGEHADFEEYKYYKSRLFSMCKTAIINKDDKYYKDMVDGCSCADIHYYSIENDSEYQAGDIAFCMEKGVLSTHFSLGDMKVSLSLPGYFSVYNALSAIAVCRILGVEEDSSLKALLTAKVKGRIEAVDTGRDFSIFIDYAHNAMSLESILKTLRDYGPKRLITVFGCGGNRDPERRFLMGEVSGRLSDFTVITSDNPRFEDPDKIMADIKTGLEPTGGSYIMIADRQEALDYAVSHAGAGDVILLAGKGHENYQEIQGVRHHMDERELCNKALSRLK